MADTALYLEVDEDITSAIDKLRKAAGPAVQIVVPKRSTMLQSVINLKLLKKAAADDGKELVLITGDRVATDLAARVGLAVAPTLGAKAVMAEVTKAAPVSTVDDVIEADDPAPDPEALDLGDGPLPPPPPSAKPVVTRRSLDDAPPAKPAASASAVAAAAGAAEDSEPVGDAKPSKVAKVPSFSKLKRRIFWVGGLVALIVVYNLGMYLLASATVKIYAVGTKISVSTSFAADTKATSSNNATGVLAAQTVTFTKQLSGPVTPTGTRDDGTKASGTVTVSNHCYNPGVISAGTVFAYSNGQKYMNATAVTVPDANTHNGNCSPNSVTVSVQAVQNGDSYNIASGQALSIGAVPSSGTNYMTAVSQGAFSGGTSKISPVVLQADVDTAQAALIAGDKTNVTSDLAGKLPSGFVALGGSQATAASSVVASPAVGQEGQTATVTLQATYTELAVKQSDYKSLITAIEQKQIGAGSQIYDDGIASAQVTAGDNDAAGRPTFQFSTDAYGGAKLDPATIAKQLAGRKSGDASATASGLPGVDHVDISLSPAWTTKLPGRTSRIHVTVSVANSKS